MRTASFRDPAGYIWEIAKYGVGCAPPPSAGVRLPWRRQPGDAGSLTKPYAGRVGSTGARAPAVQDVTCTTRPRSGGRGDRAGSRRPPWAAVASGISDASRIASSMSGASSR